MPSWRLASSLVVLRAELDAAFPRRSKTSDGSIGDAAHASRRSDHNPWVKRNGLGIVTAIDVTTDGQEQVGQALLAALKGDRRVKYIIWHGRIMSGTGQDHPAWVWRRYTGSNRHDHHMHISVKSSADAFDSESPWGLTTQPATASSTPSGRLDSATVSALQRVLRDKYRASGLTGPLVADGDLGRETIAALQRVIQHRVLTVGAATQTWPIDGVLTPRWVRRLQYLLKVDRDGILGTRSVQALQAALRLGTF